MNHRRPSGSVPKHMSVWIARILGRFRVGSRCVMGNTHRLLMACNRRLNSSVAGSSRVRTNMGSLGTFTVKAIYSAGMIDRINGLDSVGPNGIANAL